MLGKQSLAALALLLGIGGANAADIGAPTELNSLVVGEPVCADGAILGRIKQRFASAEATLWHRGFTMASIGNPRPSGHPYAEPGLVKRDYCEADSVMTNGSRHPVYYVIEHGLGFAGVGRSLDFCVLGLDPWHIYDGACRTVR